MTFASLALAVPAMSAATAVAETTPFVPDEAVLGAAQSSRDYPLYWLGRSFEGLPLVHVARAEGGSTRLPGVGLVTAAPVTSFIYGACALRVDGSGCSPEVQIQISPVCGVPPLVTPRSPRPIRHTRIRGARAFLFPAARWELITRHTSVRVFAGGRRGRRVMEALAGFNPPTARVMPGDTLSAPDPRALRGRLPCQRAFDFLGVSGLGVDRIEREGSVVRVELGNAPLAAGAIRIVDADPSDGRARIEVALRRAFRSGRGEGVTVAVRTLSRRRAAVVFSAEPGRFESVRTRLLRFPARLIVELVPRGG